MAEQYGSESYNSAVHDAPDISEHHADEEDGDPDAVLGLHRRHSLTNSVFVSPDEEEDANYEDSDFGVRVPHLASPSGGDPDQFVDPELIVPPVQPASTEHRDLAPFIACPWDIVLDRTIPTPIARNGFVALPKKATEHKNIFALTKSKELAADVLDLASKLNTYDRLVNLLLIRDTFEPFSVDINYNDPSNGETPLMRACAAGLLDIVQLLYECSFNWVINFPLDVDKIDFLGTTALMKAAQHGHLIIVKYLLEVLMVSVDMVDFDGWSALMFAASKGHWHVVEYLVLARDADVMTLTLQKDSALMLAANNGYLNVVRFLVEHTDAGDRFDEESLAEKAAALQALQDDADEEEPPEEEQKTAEEEDDEDEEDEDAVVENERTEYVDARAARRASQLPGGGTTQEAIAERMRAEEELRQVQLSMQGIERRGLEQQNQKGWTALIGAAHYGQLYVVHYLVSKGADPTIPTVNNETARTIPLSLLARNRFGVPVIQPQVVAAIEEGLKDRGKTKRNVKRNAVEKSLLRFKRAERYMIDAERARSRGQFEIAHLLYTYAFQETRAAKLVKEEIELRVKAKIASEQSGYNQKQLAEFREKGVRETLRAEAQRNFFLAERYAQDKSYLVAIQCLTVCLQYEPENEVYIEKDTWVKKQQQAKNQAASDAAAAAAGNVVAAPPSPPIEGRLEGEEDPKAADAADAAAGPKPHRRTPASSAILT